MQRVEGVIRPYAWGSRTVLAAMQGRPVPSNHPEAELWFGAHPADPARLDDGTDLLGTISGDPEGELGAPCRAEFGDTLPYLVKVLAADEPLSLQAHPSAEQAREGFARENAAGIPLDDPERNYRDPFHKPEVVVALSRFEALAGFRDPAATMELLRALAVPELDTYLGLLAGQPDSQGLRALVTTWITLPQPALASLVPEVLAGCVRYLESGADRFRGEAKLALTLGERYPDDAGVLAALLLNRIELQPGEALYLAAGNLHAYISGAAVEVMANSDNVLRGGLTPKHVDVPELLRVLDFAPREPAELAPTTSVVGPEVVFATPAPEFRVSRVRLDGTALKRAASVELDARGPQLLVVTAGTITVRSAGRSVDIAAGSGLWMPASDPGVVVTAHSPAAEFFRTLVGGH
ncbi:mannose-6-phosphate isomerase OS=Tsukamurella paurometabola (strain ATCC 8368 / DSM / CCUG 35730/ CIP 100753 / JCM 10117 / KCTC 9821 / NBRC 16120 / NCIMB 702349 / NCTC 13040) OX=521096 GN=Tpau_1189 PE=3 SV=1 [Tsukamurella paurometabola]|uniref:mannose-6-phosphate isomerase n=1 Tax=Tsukamurella paurometabola (strain ATCC 8368 / DSM 20162 / CCUG 35730 / CIP 100753 / JCM 10117 / KCTC 9821 / NBRC 16120 / NCIMB 702349 / NCTC 13040) TaxID=521096 RepID=D5UW13_TSUPD|nr:mannose-6-phosphate isomerase, class I [Tsukamurella paurometabola]ADG77820.1 mannose-6-phosphate isomerase, class I [Tsukamurella paurometabola DSM 20162]SUP28884.1 Mannose-6-phosphate isomerase [Tsukamurella paurometabola]